MQIKFRELGKVGDVQTRRGMRNGSERPERNIVVGKPLAIKNKIVSGLGTLNVQSKSEWASPGTELSAVELDWRPTKTIEKFSGRERIAAAASNRDGVAVAEFKIWQRLETDLVPVDERMRDERAAREPSEKTVRV